MIPDFKTIKQLLEEAIAVGSSTVLKELRPKSDALSRKKAELEFGEARIRELLEANLISLRKIGARYYLSRVEINQALCQSSIQLLYIKTQDGQQPTSDKRRVGRILGNCRRTRKTWISTPTDIHCIIQDTLPCLFAQCWDKKKDSLWLSKLPDN